ncbi:LysR family transcriptional regulator [Citrobacter werkmanii]|nr:LysR family transcriptional regulator [Citrobacter werkmanii]
MANLYDLKKFDLNLLVIFECIYQHLSISKAAETLYITPSAVSQSLQRLRTQFNDPLFIRSGKGITPTVTGINIHRHLKENLNRLEQTINIMHNSGLKKKFVIYCPQLTTNLNIDGLIHDLREEESDIEIEHHDILVSAETAENILVYRKADLVVTAMPIHNRSIVCTLFKTIENVLVRRNNHSRLTDSSTLEEIMQEQFTLFLAEDVGIKERQAHINNALINRNIGFSSDSTISITNIIATTDIIGVIPRAMFEYYGTFLDLKEVNIGYALPTIPLFLLYNRASLSNTAFYNYITKISSEVI